MYKNIPLSGSCVSGLLVDWESRVLDYLYALQLMNYRYNLEASTIVWKVSCGETR